MLLNVQHDKNVNVGQEYSKREASEDNTDQKKQLIWARLELCRIVRVGSKIRFWEKNSGRKTACTITKVRVSEG